MSSAPSHKVSDLIAANKLWIGDGYRAKNSELGLRGFHLPERVTSIQAFTLLRVITFPRKMHGRRAIS